MVSDFVPAGEAGGEEELEVEEGEEVTVEALETGGAGALVARIRTLSGETGLVPMEHLEVAAEEVNGAAAAGDAPMLPTTLRSGLSSGALSEQDQAGEAGCRSAPARAASAALFPLPLEGPCCLSLTSRWALGSGLLLRGGSRSCWSRRWSRCGRCSQPL